MTTAEARRHLRAVRRHAVKGLAALDDDVPAPWHRDISAELARNPGPYTSKYLQDDGGWWQRRVSQIDGVTIHHTLSNSPYATAAHYVTKEGGRPTIPYTIWVTQTGEILLCVPLTEGLWHDHTGAHNTHLSVGMAGTLHLYQPADAQLNAAAAVAAWAVQSPQLPLVRGVRQIKGHMDYISTACPGWNREASGLWKADFYYQLKGLLDE